MVLICNYSYLEYLLLQSLDRAVAWRLRSLIGLEVKVIIKVYSLA